MSAKAAAKDTLETRVKAGRALRESVPRESHVAIGHVKKRDIEKLLQRSSAGRVKALVPLRYGRMLESPFAFYRGSAIIQAHDLAHTPHSGIIQQICGDAHLMNFGGFATPERNLVFDMNDFDETHPGPWEWDLKRLAASVTVAARHLGIKSSTSDEIVFDAVESYRNSMAGFAQMSALDLWYEKLTFDYMLAHAKHEEGRKAIRKILEKAQERTSEGLLPKMADKVDGRWVMRDTPPTLFHFGTGAKRYAVSKEMSHFDVMSGFVQSLYRDYLKTLSASHRELLGRFTFQDMAFKVVGVGSVGTLCGVALMTDIQEQPLFLQLKQASTSVLARYVKAGSAYAHQGQRVVVGQRLMQSASDMFLGWATGPGGRDFYFRQLRDMKVSVELESLSEMVFGRYAALCCLVLARAHARAGGLAPQISGYLGKSGQFAEAIVAYANGYADQVERDYAKFRAACRAGRLVARSEADFAADLSM